MPQFPAPYGKFVLAPEVLSEKRRLLIEALTSDRALPEPIRRRIAELGSGKPAGTDPGDSPRGPQLDEDRMGDGIVYKGLNYDAIEQLIEMWEDGGFGFGAKALYHSEIDNDSKFL